MYTIIYIICSSKNQQLLRDVEKLVANHMP